MVLMAKADGWTAAVPVLLAILLTFVASYALLRGALGVQRFLGHTGVAVLQRVMGLLLAAIAVQLMVEGGATLWMRVTGTLSLSAPT
jgi:multiple antibiotic resistance protein